MMMLGILKTKEGWNDERYSEGMRLFEDGGKIASCYYLCKALLLSLKTEDMCDEHCTLRYRYLKCLSLNCLWMYCLICQVGCESKIIMRLNSVDLYMLLS